MHERAGQTLALTGATGFVGDALMKAALAQGYKVRALTRRPQASINNLDWINGALNDINALDELCKGADVVVHVAGAIKAKNHKAFLHVNETGTKTVLNAAEKAGVLKQGHFIHVSSLAAREKGMSSYAYSKYMAEQVFHDTQGQWSIIRPPAVYGPGDQETLKLFKAMKMGFAPMVGSKDNRFSLIHVQDLANGILAMASKVETYGQTYEISDANTAGYTMMDMAKQASDIMGWRVRCVPLPTPLVKTVGAMNDAFAPLFGVIPILGRGKARELAHSDWVAQHNLLNTTDIWSPTIAAGEGLDETLKSYAKDNLL